MKLSSLFIFFICFLAFSCKTPRPDISKALPTQMTKDILEKNPFWSINIATINTYSIPVLPPFRQERISLIGDRIDHFQFDYVSIQEAFSSSVRKKLYARSLMPHQFYFDVKGTIGSGMVMLSKFPLEKKSFWYHLLMGRKRDAEFWSGKGIAKTTIIKDELPVSLYNVHLLSRLSKNSDEYTDYNSVDRLSELFEVFTQIIEQRDSDAFAILGDFNMNSKNKEFDFFRNLTQLEGTYFKDEESNFCTYCEDNTFNTKSEGVLDYIWLSPRLEFLESEIFLKKTFVIDGKPSNLSDHYGVRAKVGIKSGQLDLGDTKALKRKSLAQIRWLKNILIKELKGIDPFKEIGKGVTERLCRSCRIKDVIAIASKYIKAFDEKVNSSALNEDEFILRNRIESYFSLF
jgi:endonuclease/exonuclease/phosphatase family metal-dependent hydrolase